jgi:alpha-glucosidase
MIRESPFLRSSVWILSRYLRNLRDLTRGQADVARETGYTLRRPMKPLAATALLLLAAAPASAQEWALTSPDGKTTIAVTRQTDGRLQWHVSRDGSPILADSPLGIRRADQSFETGLTLVLSPDPIVVDDRYQLPHGKRHNHVVHGRERTLTFANASGARIEVVLRAHEDGVAIRYRFPDADGSSKTVVAEQTGFHVPEGSSGWLLPQQEVSKYGPAYEDLFMQVAAGTAAPRPDGWSFPALFKTPSNRWLLITEAALDEGYCGSHLAADSAGGVYRLKFPDPKEGLGVGAVEPVSTLPWTLPWRVVIIGDSAARILESDLVLDLSPASKAGDWSWIKPGRAAWSWWSKSDSPKHAEDLNAFTDLAAEMGWEYALVDANWNFMQTGTIDDVIAHAKAKNVGLLFWYNSGGPHNDVTEAPRDRMADRNVRRAEFAKLQAWGVKGVKVDFWHSDKQDRIRQYRDILRDAADFHMLVNFHGCTIPRGWSREFPNLIGMEAVYGAEQYKFRGVLTANGPRHNTVLPFTRNVVGPMDYTPVTFSNTPYPHTTTNAHELALSVVFETAIQHFADSVESYRGLPDAPKQFLRQVPTAWDDTRALSGEPGRDVVVARRADEIWYVGGISAQDAATTARAPLSFLGPGSWTMTTIRDGATDRTFETATRTVTAADSIDVVMRPHGGFVCRIVKAGR